MRTPVNTGETWVPEVFVVTIHDNEDNDEKLDGVFDLKEGAFVEAYSSGTDFPIAVVPLGLAFKRLTVQLSDVRSGPVLHQLIRMRGLLKLNITTYRQNILREIEYLDCLWCNSLNLLRLTLLERSRNVDLTRVVGLSPRLLWVDK